MKTLAALLAATALHVAPAQAQSAGVIDLETVTCKQLLEMKPDRIDLVLAWLQSYYQAEEDPARIDLDKMGADKAKLAEYCGKKSDENVIDAADELFDKDK